MPAETLYATADEVRREAGFSENSNIIDTDDILPYLQDAEAEIMSAVCQNYILPLSNNSGWAGSPAQALLKGIALQLAAGFILLRQYEGQGEDMQNMAMGKISHARSRLKLIEKGQLRLFGTGNSELSTRAAGSLGLSGWPSATTAEDDPDSGPKYSMSKKF